MQNNIIDKTVNINYQQAVNTIMKNKQKAFFDIASSPEIAKKKRIYAINKMLARANNYTNNELLNNYEYIVQMIERILELKEIIGNELKLIFDKYHINVLDEKNLKEFILTFHTIGLQELNKVKQL